MLHRFTLLNSGFVEKIGCVLESVQSQKKQTITMIFDLLNKLESISNEDEIQETLKEIKAHLIRTASSSKNILNSAYFYNFTSSQNS